MDVHLRRRVVSLIIIVKLLPSIFIAPYLGAITDRARAGRVLFCRRVARARAASDMVSQRLGELEAL